ncbi:MAG: hypothetical protein V1915_04810 [Candidatus Bathyarchaeota archaeon]
MGTWEGYIQIPVGTNFAYIREGSLDRLKEVDAAIFDCDGVLIDTRDSYRKSIVETVKYFLSQLTDVELPFDEILRETTYFLKRSGGFNNDWDATYAILLFLFSKMPKDFQSDFITVTGSKDFIQAETLQKRFDYIKRSVKNRPSHFSESQDKILKELKLFAQRTDDSGIDSIEKELINSSSGEIVLATKRFLNYPDGAKESLLATVFDEMFYGPELFELIYGRKRQFCDKPGFVEIEKEKTLVTLETLTELAQVIGRENFGIVSGRDKFSARFSLGTLLDKFRRDAVLFLMDHNYSKKPFEEQMKLKKPNPYPLIKSAKGLDQFKYSLYIGDSAEDLIMVKRANEIDRRFISVGVYALSDFKDELISFFFSSNTDIILHSIKELPAVLREVKVRK